MINIVSVLGVAGIFATAVNLLCASTPASVIQILGLAMM
jgi:hypothetical protein